MGKTEKIDEHVLETPPYEKRQRKRKISRKISRKNVRTREQIINEGHYALQPMAYMDKISEREKIRQQKSIDSIISECNHNETIVDTNGLLICKYCGVKIKKKKDKKEIIKNLFCTHKETIEKNGFLICVKCKEKLKRW